MDYFDVLEELLSLCSYPEDVEAAEHFVFHPRLNGCSSMCLLCHTHANEHTDHPATCPYRVAYERCAKSSETLEEYVKRQ